jgi:hypothetical protein
MQALARTTDADCYTRAANDECFHGGPRNRTKSTYDYVRNNPVWYYDPIGLLQRGGGWNNPQWNKIQQAASAIRQELKKSCSCGASGGGCIPCDVAKNLADRLDNSTVSEAPLGGDCGVGNIPGYSVFLSPVAFTKRCDCLASTLYHELLHNVGLEHEDSASGPGVTALEKRCMGTLCKKGGGL